MLLLAERGVNKHSAVKLTPSQVRERLWYD